MNKSIIKITTLISAVAAFFCFPVMTSCSGEEVTVDAGAGSGQPITVSAEVARQLYTRGYQSEGVVSDGVYYLTYPSNSGNGVATVTFGRPEPRDDIGFVTTADGQGLEWNMVGSGANPVFYLDNVSPELDARNEANLVDINFGNDNPYVAGLFDLEDGTNDLLWGTKQVGRDSKSIDFDLHHNMSRIRVEVTVDKTNAFENELDLEGARVEISSLLQTPLSYNRLDGSLTLGAAPEDYSSLVLVDAAENEKLDWAGEPEDKGDNVWVYTTKDFVLPPQGLLEDERRPQLTIKTRQGKVYQGILPHAMEVVYPDKENPYPVTLYFLKEHILTIRTKITQAPPELSFMPVQVIDWVDKGNFTLEGHQAGLYLTNDFYSLCSYYGTNNEFQLERYGYIDPKTDTWVFNVFQGGIVLDLARIKGTMKPAAGQRDYRFEFNGYKILIDEGNETYRELSGAEGARELYRIVTGS